MIGFIISAYFKRKNQNRFEENIWYNFLYNIYIYFIIKKVYYIMTKKAAIRLLNLIAAFSLKKDF